MSFSILRNSFERRHESCGNLHRQDASEKREKKKGKPKTLNDGMIEEGGMFLSWLPQIREIRNHSKRND